MDPAVTPAACCAWSGVGTGGGEGGGLPPAEPLVESKPHECRYSGLGAGWTTVFLLASQPYDGI